MFWWFSWFHMYTVFSISLFLFEAVRKPEITFYPYSQLNVSQQHVPTRNISYYRLIFFQLWNLENVYVCMYVRTASLYGNNPVFGSMNHSQF
jgi:hypothetical protein